MAKEKKILFHNINPKAWEHPADRAALSALKQIPGLDVILKNLLGVMNEKSFRLLFLASAVRVSERQFPLYYKQLRDACDILDSPYLPEMFIAQNPIMNAGAFGVNKPFIVLNSSIIEKLTEEESLAIIGHELGHCLSGHALYHTLLNLLIFISRVLLGILRIPISEIILQGIIYGLLEWYRKSELSADRAGLLVVQNPNVSYQVLMKLAGGTKVEQMDINEFFQQAADYECTGDIVDSVYKILLLIQQTHPFPVLRLTELKTWIDKGDYNKILAGDYIKKGEKENVMNDFKDATNQYQEDFKTSNDPLAKAVYGTMSNVMEGANKATEDVQKFFNDLFANFGKTSPDNDKEDDEDKEDDV
ncbi:MAG: M48 family metallopeptidase [Spirochaetales bacterium]|nr:M48 family metallopeptidase [Spirochaetales bacterium]